MTAEKVITILYTTVNVMLLSLIDLLWTNTLERLAGFRVGDSIAIAMMKASKIRGGHTRGRLDEGWSEAR